MELKSKRYILPRERERVKLAAAIFSFENILKCYYECRKRKRYTINAAKFEINFESELLKLQKELKEHTYKPGRSICFIVTEPKPREIFGADFKDRVVHHVLVRYLESVWEPKFIGQSYSCRKEKGANKAIKDLKRYIRKASCDNYQPVYYLQADIKSFFISLKKDILFGLIKKHIKNPEILWLVKTIIFHNPTLNYFRKCRMSLFDLIPNHKSLFRVSSNQGLPIGNLTSQFFANVYLNELDQFVKHKLKIRYYLRYVDDLILLSQNKEQLKKWRDEIDKFLRNNLKLELHPGKEIIQDVNKGINFVGFITRPSHVLIRRRIVKKLKQKLWILDKYPGEISGPQIKKILSTVNSYYGQFKHVQTFNLRKKLWQNNFGILQKFLMPADPIKYDYFKIKNA